MEPRDFISLALVVMVVVLVCSTSSASQSDDAIQVLTDKLDQLLERLPDLTDETMEELNDRLKHRSQLIYKLRVYESKYITKLLKEAQFQLRVGSAFFKELYHVCLNNQENLGVRRSYPTLELD